MLSALAGGELVEYLSASSALKAAAAIAAVAPLAVVIATPLLLSEPRSPASREAFRNTLQGIVAALKSRQLWLVAAFLFLYAFAPGFGTPLYYHMTDTLRFSQSYIGILGSIASAGWIAGALLHRWLMRRIERRNPALISARASAPVGRLVPAAYRTRSTAAIPSSFANGVASMIATIASLTLAARHCPRRAEGFAFAGLMSVSNLAEICSINAGAYLYEHVFSGHLAPQADHRSAPPRRRSPPCWSPCSACAQNRWIPLHNQLYGYADMEACHDRRTARAERPLHP